MKNQKIFNIRPLKWVHETYVLKESYTASTEFGEYAIVRKKHRPEDAWTPWSWGYLFVEYHDETHNLACKNLEDAKEQAEAHWHTRIKTALQRAKPPARKPFVCHTYAVTVEWLPQTATKPARLRASTPDCKTILSVEAAQTPSGKAVETFAAAFRQLCRERKWDPTYTAAAQTGPGTWVFLGR